MSGNSNPGEYVVQYPSELMRKLSACISQIQYVQKRGRNQQQRYNYAADEDVVREVRRVMLENGLTVFATIADVSSEYISLTNQQGKEYRVHQTTMAMDFQLVDTETGAALPPARFYGASASPGDKQINICTTMAMKYWMLKTFLIPTGDDAEGAPEPVEPKFKPETAPEQPAPKQSAAAEPASSPATAPTVPESESSARLTDEQRDALYEIILESGVNPEAFKRMLTQYYKVERLVELTPDQARHVMEEFQDAEFVRRVEEQYGNPDATQPSESPATGSEAQDESDPQSIVDELISDGIEEDDAKVLANELIHCTAINDYVQMFTAKRDKYGPDHPIVKRLQREIRRATDAQMAQ